MNWSKPDFWDFSPFCNGALVPKGSCEESCGALDSISNPLKPGGERTGFLHKIVEPSIETTQNCGAFDLLPPGVRPLRRIGERG